MLGMGHDEAPEVCDGAAAPVDVAALKAAAAAVTSGAAENARPLASAPADAAAEETEHEPKAESEAEAHAEAAPQAPAADGQALLKEQMKFCTNTLRGLKRHSQAAPFQQPVDPVALGIPEYANVITHPMDLSTIQRKLDAGEYAAPADFAADVRLMLANCFTFNHPDSVVAKMGRALEKYFEGAFGRMPTTLPAPRAAPSADAARVRRDAHMPRRASVAASSASSAGAAPRARPSGPELAFCGTVLRELFKKTHVEYTFPFLEPVDPVRLGIPDYHDVIKTPMDLGTVRRKYETGRYADASAFEADVRLVFANCYAYNAPDSDVVAMCRRVEAVFEDKWAQKPGPRAASSPRSRAPARSHAGDAGYNQAAIDELDSDSEKILEINRQMNTLQTQLSDLLMKRANRGHDAPRAAPAPSAPRKPAPRARPAKPVLTEEDFLARPMSFEEKRQLSIYVNDLEPERLGRVVEIIQEGMVLDAEGESDTIELDIEALDVRTLRNLQRYVMGCRGVTDLAAILGETSAPKRKKTAAPAPQAAPLSPPPADELSSDDDDL